MLEKLPSNPEAGAATKTGGGTASLAVLIVGMHRSGTSALGGVLHMLGVPAPADLIAADRHNQRGYFEPQAIIDFHERLFEKLGSPSNDPLPLTYDWLASPVGEAAATELADLLDDEFGDNAMCLFKDPRMCRMAPVWTAALERSGRDAVAILPCRHPLEVAGSLAAKAGLSRAWSLFMWLQHVVLGERFTRDLKRSFTAYDALMQDWRAVARQLEADLGIAWPRDMVRAGADIDAFLTGELRRQAGGQALDEAQPLDALCARAWAALARLQAAPYDAQAMAEMDAVWADFETGLPVFAPLVVSYQRDVGRLETDVRRLFSDSEALGRRLMDVERRFAVSSRIAGDASRAMRDAKAELEAATERLLELEKVSADALSRAASAEAHYRAISESTFWKLGHPVRKSLERFPGLRRLGRGVARAAWWAATFKLGRKLDERRRAIAAMAEGVDLQSTPQEEPPPPPNRIAVKRRPERILFISGEPGTPGHLYRVVRYAAAARMAGFKAEVVALEDVQGRLDAVGAADVIILWRTAWDENVEAALKAARAADSTVVFDIDDLMFEPDLAKSEFIDAIRSQKLEEAEVAAFYERVRAVLASAQFGFTTTPFLADRMRRYDKPTLVLPNGFDEDVLERSRFEVRLRRIEQSDGLVRIGYAGGTRTHQKDFAQVAAAVARVLRDRPACRLVLFRSGDKPLVDVLEFPEFDGLEDQIEWRDMVKLRSLPAELARFDINLAPLEVGNPFCEAKSELKFFEAALVDVPTVASPTEPFRGCIRDGENGFLAADEEAWRNALLRLVDDPDLRRETARRAFYDSLADYGPERRAELFLSAMEMVSPDARRAGRAFELEIDRLRTRIRPRPHIPPHEILFEVDHLRNAEVTVVVPLYNYAGFVVEALESVKAQTVSDLDLIVVDDASTDDSQAIAREWIVANAARFNRVLLIRNRPNAGLGFTRNVAFANAETPFVLPLDADNRLGPECVEKSLAAIRESGASLAYAYIRHFGDDEVEMGLQVWHPARLVYGNFIDAMALVRRSAWARVGGYDHVRYGWEDYDFWCRLVEQGGFAVQVREFLADYRVHGSSMLRSETEVARNKVRLLDDIERRHPWLRVVRDIAPDRSEPGEAPPDPIESIAFDHEAQARRLERFAPFLRDPETGRKLEWVDGELRTVGSGRPWPMVKGRPLLFPSLGEPKVMAPEHVSNGLPSEAIALIEAVDGLVLNLSAGGSGRRYDHVVEAEVAVFRHTDVIADAHALPFADETFELVVCFNAFEHYHTPSKVASEILRVLKPGGRVLMSTAFLQPLHEAPWHFYNATRYGLEKWFEAFEKLDLRVTENFNPLLALSWQMSEAEAALRDLSARDAERLLAATGGDLVDIWRDREARTGPLWTSFNDLSQARQEPISAGFQFLGRKPG